MKIIHLRLGVFASSSAFLLFLYGGAYDAVAQTVPHPTDADVGLVAAVLREHPELVVDALATAKREQEAKVIAEKRNEIEHDPVDQGSGNPNGDVTVVEFSDYQCPYCKAMVSPVRDLLKSDPKIRFVLKEFPVLAPISMDAAKVALASAADGKYDAVHSALMGRHQPLDQAALRQTALDTGMTSEEIDAALRNGGLETSLKAHVELGKALGLTGTPTFIIGNERLVGAVTTQQLADAVARAREAQHRS